MEKKSKKSTYGRFPGGDPLLSLYVLDHLTRFLDQRLDQVLSEYPFLEEELEQLRRDQAVECNVLGLRVLVNGYEPLEPGDPRVLHGGRKPLESQGELDPMSQVHRRVHDQERALLDGVFNALQEADVHRSVVEQQESHYRSGSSAELSSPAWRAVRPLLHFRQLLSVRSLLHRCQALRHLLPHHRVLDSLVEGVLVRHRELVNANARK